VADFETTTANQVAIDGHSRVWSWGLADIWTADTAWDVNHGTTMEEFIGAMMDIGNATVYFHNLKFDGNFIFNALFERGYQHTTERYLRPYEFSTLISDMGQFYSIKVKWGKSNVVTEFRDSMKKLPFSVERIAEAFQLPVQKQKINYHTYRPLGHQLTRDELSYLCADVLIMAKAMRTQLEQGMVKLTAGADALAEYKQVTGGKLFDRLFPLLNDEVDSEIRKAYRGGWCYVDHRIRGKRVKAGKTFDVNSLYPSVMYSEVLPYGEPVHCKGMPRVTKDYPLFIVTLTFTAKLKRGHLPCIQIKNSSRFNAVEYQREIKDPITLTCTNVDLDLWQEHYHLDILAAEDGWLFKGQTGFFNDYIEKWMKIKEESTGAMRELAKLMLNSLYGKFATNPDVTGKYPVYEDGIVSLKMGEPETRDPVYTAMGVFITAYARDKTIRAAQANYTTFAYADTDSLHLLTTDEPIGLEVHKSKLGAWKHEYDFTEAKFQAPKRYIEHKTDGEFEVHVAGLPKRLAETLRIEDFGIGKVIPAEGIEYRGEHLEGKLMPKRVPGGIVLTGTSFTLDM
jgi:hypothetical protein